MKKIGLDLMGQFLLALDNGLYRHLVRASRVGEQVSVNINTIRGYTLYTIAFTWRLGMKLTVYEA